MELTASRTRPIRMKHSVRGLIAAAALSVVLAGCGTTVAGSGASSGSGSGVSSGASSGASPRTSSSAITTSTTAGACASADEATKVTALRAMHLVEPARISSLEATQTNPGIVRALFRDFCQVIGHKDTASGTVTCPNDIGLSYSGTFYAGTRPVATYTYAASGCEMVTVTGAGKSARAQSAMVIGTAAAAAPHLHADMARALGMAEAQVFHPNSVHVNQGSGPSK
jgi:hypothetical protein